MSNDHITAIRDALYAKFGGPPEGNPNMLPVDHDILAHAEAMASELEAARRERNYWKSVAEDPGIYWSRLNDDDNPPPYCLDDDESEVTP